MSSDTIQEHYQASKLSIDRAALESLKATYHEAVVNSRISFEFQGEILNTAYAKGLIEYLDNLFATPLPSGASEQRTTNARH